MVQEFTIYLFITIAKTFTICQSRKVGMIEPVILFIHILSMIQFTFLIIFVTKINLNRGRNFFGLKIFLSKISIERRGKKSRGQIEPY